MPPFSLPDFYLPYPARLNPNLERTRVHSTAWAARMGMLDAAKPGGGVVWDEADLAAMDYALLCAYTHPDCDGPTLDLVTDWYVWVFFFDDHFLDIFKTARPGRGEGVPGPAAAFMPPDPARPADQPGRGGPGRPVGAHRARHVRRLAAPVHESTHNLLDESLWELANINDRPDRQPDRVHRDAPQGRRRAVVGEPGRARRRRPRSPTSLAGTRPMRVLTGHLRRRRAPAQRPVLLPARGRGGGRELPTPSWCSSGSSTAPTQQAADRVNDLLTSRLQQFEHTALTEVPALLAECAPCPRHEQVGVARLRQGPAGLAGRRPRVARAVQPVHERRARPRAAPAVLAAGRPGSAPRPRRLLALLRSAATWAAAAGPAARATPRRPAGRAPAAARVRDALPDSGSARTWTPRGGTWSSGRRADGHASTRCLGSSRRAVGRAGSWPGTTSRCAPRASTRTRPGAAGPDDGLAGLGHLRRRLLTRSSSAAHSDMRGRREGRHRAAARCSCRWTRDATPVPLTALERGLADLWRRTAGPMDRWPTGSGSARRSRT